MRTLALALLALSPLVALAAPTSNTAVFDWFEYTGRDRVFNPPLPEGHYQNPILAGFYPDPSICRVGDDFYLVNSSFAYFPGLPIFHSRDLAHWEQIGHVIDRIGQLNYRGLGVSRALFAPTIRYHDGLYYVICTMVDSGGNFFVTAKDPAGPWSEPIWMSFEGIDPSFFFDADGRAWVVNNGAPEGKPLYSGHRSIWIQEFDLKTQKLVGPRSVLVNGGVDLAKKPIWIEGPHLYKRGEWYYLLCAEGGTDVDHREVIFRSKSVTGPYTPWEKNPILTQRDLDPNRPNPITCAGHADFVEGPDGNWWTVFLACRPYAKNLFPTGRETFLLPVTWTDDGWPMVLPHGETIPLTPAAPKISSIASKPAADNRPPLTGNFTWRDDFNDAKPSLLWTMLRNSPENWWDLRSEPGHLLLKARADRLSGAHNPSYFGRRVQQAFFDASTSVAMPQQAGLSAGLAVFQNETHHYFFAVRRGEGGKPLVFLERYNGANPEIAAQKPLVDADHVELRLNVDGARAAFSYATVPGRWETLVGDADATLLTTAAAGGFVGATVGVHARLEETQAAGSR